MAARKRKRPVNTWPPANAGPLTLICYDRRGEELDRHVLAPRIDEFETMDSIMKMNPVVVKVECIAFDGTHVSEMERAEALLSVHYSYAFPPDKEKSRFVQRVPVTADLGIDYDPAFTQAEMNQIMYAAKMEAGKIIMSRTKKRRMKYTKYPVRRGRRHGR